MPVVKKSMWILILFSLLKPAFAIPPFQILKTCIDRKPYDDKLTLIELDDASASDKPLDDCEDQYTIKFNGHTFGSSTCKNKFYLIINGKKINPALAENRSINPEIKPGVEFTPRAMWYKIDYENTEYLCILAPLAEQGIGSAHNQYYIIENAFNKPSNPALYFYFLDKNIAPITSRTL